MVVDERDSERAKLSSRSIRQIPIWFPRGSSENITSSALSQKEIARYELPVANAPSGALPKDRKGRKGKPGRAHFFAFLFEFRQNPGLLLAESLPKSLGFFQDLLAARGKLAGLSNAMT